MQEQVLEGLGLLVRAIPEGDNVFIWVQTPSGEWMSSIRAAVNEGELLSMSREAEIAGPYRLTSRQLNWLNSRQVWEFVDRYEV